MQESIKGNLTIDEIEFSFLLEGQTLLLTNKKVVNKKEILGWWKKFKAKFMLNALWIHDSSTGRTKRYIFHCSSPYFLSCHEISLYVDYYAVYYSDILFENFGEHPMDGFFVTQDFIGEFIKDTISTNSRQNESLTISFTQKKNSIQSKAIEFSFGYEVIGDPKYRGIDAIKPVLKTVKKNTVVDELISIYDNVASVFAFIFRKNYVLSSNIKLFRNSDDNIDVLLADIFFTNYENNDIELGHVTSSLILPYFNYIYDLVASGELSCYHIPANRKFEITHLILMYSWFEKLYKTIPLNQNIELKSNRRGKLQLVWKYGTSKASRFVSEKEQLSLVLQDNPKLKDYAYDLLMRLGGLFHTDEFYSEFPKRVSSYRNDIIHNDDILWYPFIIQDTRYLELINYYLIFKYKCHCHENELEPIINSLFFDISKKI